MFTAFTNEIQEIAVAMTRQGLLGAAIACTFAGLVIWLSGLAIPRLAMASSVGMVGFFTAFALLPRSIQLLALSALAAVAVGLIIEMLLAHFLGFASFGYGLCISLLTSAFGSLLIMLGVIFLLTLQSAGPVNHINQRQSFYLTLLFALIAFGTFEQLIFCRKKIRPEAEAKSTPELEAQAMRKNSWRNK